MPDNLFICGFRTFLIHNRYDWIIDLSEAGRAGARAMLPHVFRADPLPVREGTDWCPGPIPSRIAGESSQLSSGGGGEGLVSAGWLMTARTASTDPAAAAGPARP